MHPAIFVGGFVFLGQLFALQEWITERLWNYKLDIGLLARAWGVQYFLWGVLCWLLWLWLGPKIQYANLRWIFGWMIPLSIFVSVGEEAIWVICFPNLPLSHKHMSFWHRLVFHLDAELIDRKSVV